MVRPNNCIIKSDTIIEAIKVNPCIYDSTDVNYGDRAAKARCWTDICERVVPDWIALGQSERVAAGDEVRKRWRSIRDSYTKAFRQGKCVLPENCPPGSRKYQYHKQMEFLLKVLQKKKTRYAKEKIENSPQHPSPKEHLVPTNNEYPLNLAVIKKEEEINNKELVRNGEIPEMVDKSTQADCIDQPNAIEIQIDANSIQPEVHINDDKLFLDSLVSLFTKIKNDDTKLTCRISILKIIKQALQNQSLENTNATEGVLNASNDNSSALSNACKLGTSTLSMTTRSADGSRPVRKRRVPSPLPVKTKKRGRGRPRKVRPPLNSDEDQQAKRRRECVTPIMNEMPSEEDPLSRATSVAQLTTPQFMRVYSLKRSQLDSVQVCKLQDIIKTESGDQDNVH